MKKKTQRLAEKYLAFLLDVANDSHQLVIIVGVSIFTPVK